VLLINKWWHVPNDLCGVACLKNNISSRNLAFGSANLDTQGAAPAPCYIELLFPIPTIGQLVVLRSAASGGTVGRSVSCME
jgi:hypothetical protein